MGTVIIGGGPRPGAQIYQVSLVGEDNSPNTINCDCYEIRDGYEVLMRCHKFSHAQALLPLIRSGE